MGKNRPQGFSSAVLEAAIENREFEVFLQPQVRLTDNKLIGAEALARWVYQGVNIPPVVFITELEHRGLADVFLIMMLERLAMDFNITGCCSGRDFKFSVNVMARQVNNSLPRLIEAFLDKHSINAANLAVEITETVLVRDIDAATSVIQHLRDIGVAVYLDDFGTGHSSLSYLAKLPVAGLKIPRDFVSSIGEDRNMVVVSGLCQMAKRLGMVLIAEGVETIGQREIMVSLGFDYFQGYLFSRPLCVADFISSFFCTDFKQTGAMC